MVREGWCLRVPKSVGEKQRLQLLREGRLDTSLLLRRDGADLLLPVKEPCGGCERALFEEVPERPDLPRHDLVGGIAVLLEPDAGVRGAELLLGSRPSIHTVLLPEGPVEGEFRTRRFSVLAGTPTTRTSYTEYGLRFEIDLSLAYFSPRLSGERQRVLGLMGKGERVLDMFAGVGPFAITLAPRAGIIYAADINPGAVGLMLANIALNRAGNILPLLADAARLPGILPPGFDRVVMNLPFGAVGFLDAALALCRPGGAIHLYAMVGEEGALAPVIREKGCRILGERVVHTYSPGEWLAVYDLRVE
ncbi:MAG: class I SAM-dependent methyltransferase family protein [Methanomicrobiales archaeon]|nr:class I SAM-dependent methyltransferase family protein [Methanomicrobiales archaeon]